MQSAEDGLNFARRFYSILVVALLGSFVTDVILEVPIMDEFLDLILEHDAFLCGVADRLILISFGAISSQRVRSLIDTCLFSG